MKYRASAGLRKWKGELSSLDDGIHNALFEFRSINIHHLAKIERVEVLHFGGDHHEVVQDGIIEDGLAFAVVDNAAGWIDRF